MPKQHACLAEVTVGAGGASSIIFSSISSTYTDLILKVSLRKDSNYTRRVLQLRFNGATSGYSDMMVNGSGSSVGGGGGLGGGVAIAMWDVPAALSTANTFSSVEIYIPNYRGSSQKAVSIDGAGEDNATQAYMGLTAGLSNITSAISSIELYTDQGGNFVQHSTVSLYGITNS